MPAEILRAEAGEVRAVDAALYETLRLHVIERSAERRLSANPHHGNAEQRCQDFFSHFINLF